MLLGALACCTFSSIQPMDQSDNISIYNMYRNDHIRDFLVVFEDQQILNVRNYFELGMGYENICDPKTGNSLAQQALGMKELNKEFLATLLTYDNPKHRNRLGENTRATAQRLYLSGKLSKKIYDFTLYEIARLQEARKETT